MGTCPSRDERKKDDKDKKKERKVFNGDFDDIKSHIGGFTGGDSFEQTEANKMYPFFIIYVSDYMKYLVQAIAIDIHRIQRENA